MEQGPLQDVLIGRDGFLFLVGGRHEVARMFSRGAAPKPDSVTAFVANQQDRLAECTRDGRPYKMVVFPEKYFALASQHDRRVTPFYPRHYGKILPPNLRGSILYPIDILHQIKGYYRTDTHLNLAGQSAIVKQLLEDLVSPEEREAYATRVKARTTPPEPFTGDLGLKFDPAHSEFTEKLMTPPSLKTATNGSSGNDGLIIISHNPDALKKGCVLLFADSFFRQLIPHLSVVFSDVVFCRTRFFHYEIYRAMSPDIVLCGVAERYLGRVLPDSERPHFLAYPYILGRRTEPSDTFAEHFTRLTDMRRLLYTPPRSSAENL